jgi:hypothetical protein
MIARPLVLVLVPALLAFGCGGGVSTNPLADAPQEPDAPDGAPITLTPERYVLATQTTPTNNAQARELGLDLNADAIIDNQLGMVMATFASQGFDIQESTDTAVDRGAILMLVELQADGFVASPASFTLFTGATPQPLPCNGAGDTICRHHLAGTGAFTVAADSARDTPLEGSIVGGTLTTDVNTAGKLTIQTTMMTPNAVTLNLIGARVKASPSETGIMNGVIAGAITPAEVDTKVLPQWQQAFAAAMQQDCPGTAPSCGCAAGSTGESIHGLFDTSPVNCVITVQEIKSNSLVQSLLAPDVTIDGQQALSFGIGFTAVRGAFTP